MNQYSLHEFNLLVKETLNMHLERSYWIVAEISQINLHGNGHCYLELVEKDQQYVKAKARGTIWANAFRELHPWFVSQTGTDLKQGMKILLNASLEFHEVYGMSLNIRDLDVNFTLGERERKKQETLNRLEAEGIFDMNQQLDLPNVVQRLAIVSSATAAGYEDFINQIENNPYGYRVNTELYPSTMQGDGAPTSIIESLHKIHDAEIQYDAVIVIRGGGSKMDLDCFDDYDLCAHLAQFPIPVITGIGHERDQSIADLVAKVHLKTPTSVAEYLISKMIAFESDINSFQKSIIQQAIQRVHLQSSLISELKFNFRLKAQQILQRQMVQLEHQSKLITTQPSIFIKNCQLRLDQQKKLVDAYNPEHLLKKGYSITKVNGKTLIKQAVKAGDQLETITLKKKISSTVTNVS